MKRKLKLLGKYVRTIKDSWVSVRTARSSYWVSGYVHPAHKEFVQSIHNALLFVARNAHEVLQEKIDSARAGDPSALEATKIVFDFRLYQDRLDKAHSDMTLAWLGEFKRGRRSSLEPKKGRSCLSVTLILAVLVFGALILAVNPDYWPSILVVGGLAALGLGLKRGKNGL